MNTLDLLYALDVNAFFAYFDLSSLPSILESWRKKKERLDIFERNFTVQAVQLVNRKRQFSLKKMTSVSNNL